MRSIVNMSEEDRATGIGNVRKKYSNDRACGSGDICIVTGEDNPFPAIRDAAYRQNAGGGLRHGHRQHAQNTWWRDILADRQTDRQTYIHTHHNASQPLPRAK